MRPDKILYVDDEPMALKYFERLINPMAPVLTALSVEDGKAVLRARGAEIAVLITDQRMPGATGNELLRYAREHYPQMVRMLTTAYSELGEAIEAINTGEIYRYVTKPWDLELLRSDMRNALELAETRCERDDLLREKMAVQRQQLLASRISQLAVVCAGFLHVDYPLGLQLYLQAAELSGCALPPIDWRSMDHAELMQYEAQRSIAIGQALASLQPRFAGVDNASAALQALADALPGQVLLQGDTARLTSRPVLTWLLDAASHEPPSSATVAWLAWLSHWGGSVHIEAHPEGLAVSVRTGGQPAALQPDWMADAIERISRLATDAE
ncbi:response regulator [Rhodoferax sp. WC2427]|uniref:response regulator n=1 Tax=Rhodoferax sp. WC2427 TaxID=3234144 RepID=UPI003465BD63